MDRLSSCYFCGDAVDAALEEYPLVHSDRYPDLDTDERIVLCPSCRRKLTTVIERVLASAFEDEDGPAIPEEEDPLLDVEEEPMTATAVSTPADHTEEPSDDDVDFQFDAAGAPAETDGESASAADDGPVDVMGPTDDDAPADAGTAEDASDESSSDGTEGDKEPAATYTFEKREFNKVVKLLQNREFPVDIDELVVIAQSAYEIGEPTTHEIIDALVERGVVVDDGDQLSRP